MSGRLSREDLERLVLFLVVLVAVVLAVMACSSEPPLSIQAYRRCWRHPDSSGVQPVDSAVAHNARIRCIRDAGF